jgi:hypothetical protein
LRANERASVTIVGPHYQRTRQILAFKVVRFRVPVSVRTATITLRDRTGRTVSRSVSWG